MRKKEVLFSEPLSIEEDLFARELMQRGMTFYEANQFLRKVSDFAVRNTLNEKVEV